MNDESTRREAVKKGTAYMNVWMYVIRELEDAIDDCIVDCIDCNDNSAHAWDEAVAFYTGSLEGEKGISQYGWDTGVYGKLLYALAEKRATNFKVAGVLGDSVSGGAQANHQLFQLFDFGKYLVLKGECSRLRPIVDEITKWMTIPLIQGTLRYAYKVGVQSQNSTKNKAEGGVFAASMLPLVYACSEADAATIYKYMRIGATEVDQPKVKLAIERNYGCLQITCSEVGGIWDETTGSYYDGAGPCDDTPYEAIAGYVPHSQVTDHNAIDLDQQAMEVELKAPANFSSAGEIYAKGGNSKSYAQFTVDPLAFAIPKDASIIGESALGRSVYGKVLEAASKDATVLKVQYATSDVQRTWVMCRVGGLVNTTEVGCFSETAKLLVAPGPYCPGCGDVRFSLPALARRPSTPARRREVVLDRLECGLCRECGAAADRHSCPSILRMRSIGSRAAVVRSVVVVLPCCTLLVVTRLSELRTQCDRRK